MKIFVAYPYRLGLAYREALRKSLSNPPYELTYADETVFDGHILHKINDLLSECDLAVFDLTDANPNVSLELGLAIASKHPYVVAIDRGSIGTLYSDIHGWDRLQYDTPDDLGRILRDRIEKRAVRHRGMPHGSWGAGYNLTIADDPHFADKVRSLKVESPYVVREFAGAPVLYNPTLNMALNNAFTLVNVHPRQYAVPTMLREFQEAQIAQRQPELNEDKIRLMTDLTPETLTSPHGVDVQQTNYFSSLATNELTTKSLFRTASDGHEEFVCDVFDNYVFRRGQLIPLAQSELSNHIGVTTLLITSDNNIVLQRQGLTQFDPGKMMVGASGSADWADVERAPLITDREGRPRRCLQNIVTYAVEREANEEIGVEVGPGKSNTTITGFARYIRRGGKPEFFFITYLKQRFSDIPPEIRPEEQKWVRSKVKRPINGDTDSRYSVIQELETMAYEFVQNGQASVSMLVAIAFAKGFLEHVARSLDDLRRP